MKSLIKEFKDLKNLYEITLNEHEYLLNQKKILNLEYISIQKQTKRLLEFKNKINMK